MATQASILACEIPWTEEPGGPQSMGGHKRVGHELATKQQEVRISLAPEDRAVNKTDIIPAFSEPTF